MSPLIRKGKVFFCLVVALFLSAGLPWSGWAAQWEEIVAAAKKEGKVVSSIPASAKLRKQLEKAFEDRFPGIDLETVSGRGSKAVRRIADEIKAGVHYFDAHIGGTSSMLTGLVKKKIAEPIEHYMVLPEVKDPKNWWGGHIYADSSKRFAYSFTAYLSKNFWYNADKVNPKDLRSFNDLLDPKWKGQIGFYDPRRPGAGSSTWSFMMGIKGEKFLKDLLAQDIQVTRNRRALAESLAKGKLAITIGLTYYFFRPFVESGLPVKPLPTFKEGTYASGGSGTLGIPKSPPHSNAAKVFVNWLLGKEGQEVWTKAMGQPTRRLDVDTAWTEKIGYVAAKEALTVEQYFKLENQSERKILEVRLPGRKLAKKLLRKKKK
ncbi:MAG: extracellular solute-binding protein [Candidatus Binatia bacterium]|nr:extracellular solute-binding protein [Candidatus Binatia bacterium]